METQRADPRLRRAAGVFFVVLAVACAIALWALQRWLADLAHAAPPVAQRHLLAAFVGLIGLSCGSLLALAAYLWRMGARVLAAAQFPPPGMRVVRDTTVLRGSTALRRGRILQGLGAALVLCCFFLAATAWRVYSAFSSHAV